MHQIRIFPSVVRYSVRSDYIPVPPAGQWSPSEHEAEPCCVHWARERHQDVYKPQRAHSSPSLLLLHYISLKSVHGFWFHTGSKFDLSHRNKISPLTQGLNYRSACDYNESTTTLLTEFDLWQLSWFCMWADWWMWLLPILVCISHQFTASSASQSLQLLSFQSLVHDRISALPVAQPTASKAVKDPIHQTDKI